MRDQYRITTMYIKDLKLIKVSIKWNQNYKKKTKNILIEITSLNILHT